jgi:DNA-binding NarL/FixJ family response regulator
MLALVEAGATGVVTPDTDLNEVVEILKAAHRGEAYVSPEFGAALVHRMNELARLSRRTLAEPAITPNWQTKLTARERDVLRLMAQGLSNQEIAQALIIEPGTVKNHVHSILKKLNVSSREEAAQSYLLLDAQASGGM